MWERLGQIAIIATIAAFLLALILFIEQSTTLSWVTDMLSIPLLKLVLATLTLLLLAICLWRQKILKKQIEEHISMTTPHSHRPRHIPN